MVDGRHTWGGGVPVKRSFVALEELRFCLELRSVGCAKPRMCCEQRLCASAAQSVQVLRPPSAERTQALLAVRSTTWHLRELTKGPLV